MLATRTCFPNGAVVEFGTSLDATVSLALAEKDADLNDFRLGEENLADDEFRTCPSRLLSTGGRSTCPKMCVRVVNGGGTVKVSFPYAAMYHNKFNAWETRWTCWLHAEAERRSLKFGPLRTIEVIEPFAKEEFEIGPILILKHKPPLHRDTRPVPRRSPFRFVPAEVTVYDDGYAGGMTTIVMVPVRQSRSRVPDDSTKHANGVGVFFEMGVNLPLSRFVPLYLADSLICVQDIACEPCSGNAFFCTQYSYCETYDSANLQLDTQPFLSLKCVPIDLSAPANYLIQYPPTINSQDREWWFRFAETLSDAPSASPRAVHQMPETRWVLSAAPSCSGALQSGGGTGASVIGAVHALDIRIRTCAPTTTDNGTSAATLLFGVEESQCQMFFDQGFDLYLCVRAVNQSNEYKVLRFAATHFQAAVTPAAHRDTASSASSTESSPLASPLATAPSSSLESVSPPPSSSAVTPATPASTSLETPTPATPADCALASTSPTFTPASDTSSLPSGTPVSDSLSPFFSERAMELPLSSYCSSDTCDTETSVLEVWASLGRHGQSFEFPWRASHISLARTSQQTVSFALVPSASPEPPISGLKPEPAGRKQLVVTSFRVPSATNTSVILRVSLNTYFAEPLDNTYAQVHLAFNSIPTKTLVSTAWVKVGSFRHTFDLIVPNALAPEEHCALLTIRLLYGNKKLCIDSFYVGVRDMKERWPDILSHVLGRSASVFADCPSLLCVDTFARLPNDVVHNLRKNKVAAFLKCFCLSLSSTHEQACPLEDIHKTGFF